MLSFRKFNLIIFCVLFPFFVFSKTGLELQNGESKELNVNSSCLSIINNCQEIVFVPVISDVGITKFMETKPNCLGVEYCTCSSTAPTDFPDGKDNNCNGVIDEKFCPSGYVTSGNSCVFDEEVNVILKCLSTFKLFNGVCHKKLGKPNSCPVDYNYSTTEEVCFFDTICKSSLPCNDAIYNTYLSQSAGCYWCGKYSSAFIKTAGCASGSFLFEGGCLSETVVSSPIESCPTTYSLVSGKCQKKTIVSMKYN